MDAQEIERAERLQTTLDSIDASLKLIAERLQTPSPGWRRMLDEFRGAVSRMPTNIRARF